MLVKSAGESKVDKNSFIILTQVHGQICISLTKKKVFRHKSMQRFHLFLKKKVPTSLNSSHQTQTFPDF